MEEILWKKWWRGLFHFIYSFHSAVDKSYRTVQLQGAYRWFLLEGNGQNKYPEQGMSGDM